MLDASQGTRNIEGIEGSFGVEGIEGSIDATGATANTATPTCNEYFEYDNVTATCVAVSIVCQRHTFATLTGGCTECPAGEWIRMALTCSDAYDV